VDELLIGSFSHHLTTSHSSISPPTAVIMKFLSLLPLLSLASALKFDLPAHSSHSSNAERCIRNFVTRDTLVVVTAIVSGNRGDGMVVNMHIKDAVGNDYGRPKDVAGEKRMAFTSLADTAFDVCFENILTGRSTAPPWTIL
jgi:p24 family protein delta-1